MNLPPKSGNFSDAHPLNNHSSSRGESSRGGYPSSLHKGHLDIEMHDNDKDDSFYREYVKKHTQKPVTKSGSAYARNNTKKLKGIQMENIWEEEGSHGVKQRNRGMSGATAGQ